MTAVLAPATRTRPSAGVVWSALLVVYVVWGSTYLAIRVVVEDMPPLLSAGSRFLTAGLVMATIVMLRHGRAALRVRPRELRGAAVVGVALIAGGNGGVVLGERTVTSGLAALLVAMVPLWLIVLRRASGDRPRALTWAGVLLGLVGLIVLVQPGGSGTDLVGVLFVLGATTSWSLGSFYAQHTTMPANPFVATVWEMLAGGTTLTVLGLLRGERLAAPSSYATESWVALGYLVVFGSVVAFTAYVWLLHNARLSLVSTYAYVNPVVAVALGALILGESITTAILVGGAIVVVGVALVVTAERPRPVSDPDEPPPA